MKAFIASLFRAFLKKMFQFFYKAKIKGLEHFYQHSGGVLVVANHTSFLDALLIAVFFPQKLTFAINTHVAKKWWVKPFLSLVDVCPIDPLNPLAAKTLIEKLKAGHCCMIFPEGRITITGTLMKIYEGPSLIADKAGVPLIPLQIEGAMYTPFSRLKGKVNIRWFPEITLTILPACSFDIDPSLKGRKRRGQSALKLYDIMTEMVVKTTDYNLSLFEALARAMHIHGRDHIILEDIQRSPLNYGQLMTRIMILANKLKSLLKDQKIVGLLLPNTNAMVSTFFSLHRMGKIPALLNFTAGAKALETTCTLATLQTVITSKKFVQTAKLEDHITKLTEGGFIILYLEDIAPTVTLKDKIIGWGQSFFANKLYKRDNPQSTAQDNALILFTSGSEGSPKGVVLSHTNIRANCTQIASRIDFTSNDVVFNCLPMFHSFGLTGGTLLPLLSGVKVFCYPSPLHYRVVPELIYDTNATTLFGTDTFLSGYGRFAHSYDFHNLRYVFAGAEKLKDSTRKLYHEKFGILIFEGYGATEASPVIAVNTPMQHKAGTVGRILPCLDWKLEEVQGIPEGGELWIKGPNLMKGYLKIDDLGNIHTLGNDGWYNTGDIVSFDEQGYVKLQGRTKRFAKISGEMVSLIGLEEAAEKIWPEVLKVAVILPDDKKGEQIVLLINEKTANREELVSYYSQQGLAMIGLPSRVLVTQDIPLLGTGKIDYNKAKEKANILINSSSQ